MLDAAGDVANRFHDAAVPRDIKKFEVMNIN
jgi:hypothetical protein